MNNTVGNKNAPIQRDSLTDLLGQLASNSTAVVHNEIELVIQGIRETATASRRGVVTVMIGAAIGFAAFMPFGAAMIIWLMSYMNPVMAAIVTGSAIAVVGAVIVFIGYQQLKTSILKLSTTINKEDEE